MFPIFFVNSGVFLPLVANKMSKHTRGGGGGGPRGGGGGGAGMAGWELVGV
jgi:hypothetical protein